VNNRLRELRAARRWSQADVADRLDVSRQTINAVETGRYDPSLPLAFKLAALFGLPIESLFWPDSDGDGDGAHDVGAAAVQPDRAAGAGS